jgi:hypothetical protein
MNKVVARFTDGRILKGTTTDFLPAKPLFHVKELGAPSAAEPLTVMVGELKALFFVKDFEGQAGREKCKDFDASRPAPGRRIRVVFNDGEELMGVTQGYQPDRPGFFVEPADTGSNNERCYVVAAATKEVAFL